MNTDNVLECERKQLGKFEKFILIPNYFKVVGLILTIVGFILKIILSYFENGNASVSFFSEHIVENLILVSMLLIALSREKIEDELVEKIRGQAFKFAFILGVLYTIIQPFINYFVALIVKSGKANFERLDDFLILWFMLVVYIGYFHLLRKTS